MYFNFKIFLEECRQNEESELIEQYEKYFGNINTEIKEQLWFKEYLVNFKYVDYLYPLEFENEFDWNLLLKLIVGSFSTEYSFEKPNDNELNKLELTIAVTSKNNNYVIKRISELWSFQLIGLFGTYILEQMRLQILIKEYHTTEGKHIIAKRFSKIERWKEILNSFNSKPYVENIVKPIISNLEFNIRINRINTTSSVFDLLEYIKNMNQFIKSNKESCQVFISHSTIDKPFAIKIKNKLETDEILTWFDNKDLDIGDILSDEISNGITKSSYFLIIISENSINSKWVKFELDEAYHLFIQGDKKILPCIIGNVKDEDIPQRLKKHLFADFRNDFETAYDKIIRTIIRKAK